MVVPKRKRLRGDKPDRIAPVPVPRRSLLALLTIIVATGCVPEGPPTGDRQAPAPVRAPAPLPVNVPRPKVVQPANARALITSAFEDNFDRVDLGPDWSALHPAWKIVGGRLCGKGARNRGVWLLRRLPLNARIEFEATSEAAEGDLKVELWGDGVSGATGTSYTNATSYLAIFGGWKNTKHVLARLDEHGADRLEIDVNPNSDEERERPVSPGQPYRFIVERANGSTVSWWVNGAHLFNFQDPQPLSGGGHEHLGFNDWDAPVCFDNLKITPL